MFCRQCGQEVGGTARYCSQCGAATAKADDGYAAPRRLFRLAYDSKIGGVCAGIARYLNVDVTLVRIATVAGACATGGVPGIVAYIFAWIIMPVDYGAPRPAPATQQAPAGQTT
jgi:phage shock protein C